MTHVRINDEEIVRRCRHNDHEAFSVLVGRYQAQVRNFVAARCSQYDLIDEIVQDTFVTAWEKIDGLQQIGSLLSWLCGIAKYKMLHALRNQRSSARLKVLDEQIIDMNIEEIEANKIPTHDPHLLRGCVDQLSTRSQKLVHARFEDGCTLKQLAQKFKKNHQALAKEVQRVLKKVKLCMEKRNN